MFYMIKNSLKVFFLGLNFTKHMLKKDTPKHQVVFQFLRRVTQGFL